MTTIPIEVIVQDAPAPVVPGEDGTNNTETNITVPDTGAISSSGTTSSSASSIVLPAILLVLAIGSIVAILIHKYHKQKKDKIGKKKKVVATLSGTIAVLAATVIVSNLILPATKAATSDVTDGITPAEDKVSIVVTRDGGVAEESIESAATITSSSDFGYKVLLSMAEGVETSNLYLDGDEDSEYYIAAIEGAELTDNTWGYALEEGTIYNAVPLVDDAATVAEGDEPVEDEGLSIYYGVKVSSDLPAGIYSGGNVEYNLVPIIPSSISDLTYMQDFAKLSESGKASVLRSMVEGEQYTLKDSRDDKDYFISKLADGNVWMTQNLDLDIEVPAEGSIVYDSTNTDLPANTTWEPERAIIAKDNLSSDTWPNDNQTSYNPYSYDPGDVYYYTSGTTEFDIEYSSLEECIGANHTEAECRHYHAGNYYNWSAAVASNDTSEIMGEYKNVSNSICPAGWRLPSETKIDNDVIAGSEFGKLWSDYDIIAVVDNNMSYSQNGFISLRDAPLFFTLSGYIWSGRLASVGSFGAYEVNTVSDYFALLPYFEKNYIRVASTNGPGGTRAMGIPIRCLAR